MLGSPPPDRACGSPADQRGQASIEWGAVVLLVAAIVAVVFMIGLPATVSHSIQCEVEKVFHDTTGCTGGPSPPSNELVCETSTDTEAADDKLSVLFVNVGHNNTLIETTYSDGAVQYTLVNTDSATLQADLFSAEGDVGGVGFDVELSAAAGGELAGSHTWTFPNQSAAKSFAGQVNGAGGWGVVAHDVANLGAGIPGVGPGVSWLENGALNLLGIHGAPNPDSLAKQNLTYAYEQADLVGQLNGNANFGLGDTLNAALDAELKAAGGARLITTDNPTGLNPLNSQGTVKKGDVQLFINLSGQANGALQAQLFGPSATGSAKGTATAVVTLGPDGSLQQLQIAASGDLTGRAGLHAASPKGDDGAPGAGGAAAEGEGELSKALNLDVSDGSGVGYTYTGTLNLADDPAARQELVSLLDPNSGSQAITQLAHQIDTQGSERVQPYTLTRSQGGAGLELEVADVGGGAQSTVSQQNQAYQPGWLKNPGQPWQAVLCKS